MVSIIQHALPGSTATRPPVYADYTRTTLTDQIIDGSATIVTLFNDVSALIPHAGPLCQVLGVTKELIFIINDMKDNREGCEHLVERILIFVKNVMDECSQSRTFPTEFANSARDTHGSEAVCAGSVSRSPGARL
jgi:hypothetical protein